MVRANLSAIVLLGQFFASSAVAAAGFEPGQWQHQTDLVTAEVPGIPQWLIRLAAGHRTRKSCISEAELSSHPEDLFKGDNAAACKLRKLSLAGGKIAFDTFCTNSRFPEGLLVSSQGTYTPTSYTISTLSTGMRDGKPVRITTLGSGRRVSGACSDRET